MPSDALILAPSHTALARPAPANPAAVYLASVRAGSRPAVRSTLRFLASIAAPGRDPETLPWHLLRAEHVTAIRAALGERCAARTANRALSVLRGVLKMAWRGGLLTAEELARATDGVRNFELGDVPAGRVLEEDEVRMLRQAAAGWTGAYGRRAEAILALLFGAGLRRAEVAGLDVAAWGAGAIKVMGKRQKTRMAYVPQEQIAAVEAWLKLRGSAPGRLITHVTALGKVAVRGITPAAIGTLLEALRIKAGVAPFTPHDLRRTFATTLLARGVPLGTVQDLLGHKDPKTTRIYDRQKESEKRAAVEKLQEKP